MEGVWHTIIYNQGALELYGTCGCPETKPEKMVRVKSTYFTLNY
jgi:hypothetical protein